MFEMWSAPMALKCDYSFKLYLSIFKSLRTVSYNLKLWWSWAEVWSECYILEHVQVVLIVLIVASTALNLPLFSFKKLCLHVLLILLYLQSWIFFCSPINSFNFHQTILGSDVEFFFLFLFLIKQIHRTKPRKCFSESSCSSFPWSLEDVALFLKPRSYKHEQFYLSSWQYSQCPPIP